MLVVELLGLAGPSNWQLGTGAGSHSNNTRARTDRCLILVLRDLPNKQQKERILVTGHAVLVLYVFDHIKAITDLLGTRGHLKTA